MSYRHHNRGRATQFIYGNTMWDVMDGDHGFNTHAMTNIFRLLDASLTRYSRVFVLRFDLHSPLGVRGNAAISDFFRNIQRKIRRTYRCSVLYGWAREIGEQKSGQHYHCFILLSGHKICYHSKLNDLLSSDWQNRPAHTFSRIQNPFYILNRHDLATLQDVVWRLSYLAKNRSKESKAGHRNFGFSRDAPENVNARFKHLFSGKHIVFTQ